MTFKCSLGFKEDVDRFSEQFESRSGMIREAIRHLMGFQGFKALYYEE